MKEADQEKYDILYARLSQEDEREGTSGSIEQQRIILEAYAKENNFTNPKFLYDDGYSGTSFDRPGWNEIMRLMEADLIRSVTVKDHSRLGRNRLIVGWLLEEKFAQRNIRYIAIMDNIDTAKGLSDIVPVQDLFNEWYAKNTSRKIRAVKKAQAERGERLGSRAPYGYKKDEIDTKKIVPDEDTAKIIQHIFQLCASGKGPSQIARQLKQEKVPTPIYYYYQKTGAKLTGLNLSWPYDWSSRTIASILEDEVYLGRTVSMKCTTASYKSKKQIKRPRSEWLRFENTHEAIIDLELWKMVQEVRKHKKRPPKRMEGQPSPFSGMVYCADCGAVMRLTRRRSEEVGNSLKCSTYSKRGTEGCTAHYIHERQLEAIVLDDLRRVTHYARQKEKFFVEHISRRDEQEARREISRIQKEVDRLKKRETELTTLFKRLYEDNASGRIPNEQYDLLSAEYMQERETIKSNIPKLEEQLEQLKGALSNAERFIEKAKQYTEIKELTPELLRLFIEKIVVGERSKKYSRTATQEIRIYYRDVGFVDSPEEDDLAEITAKDNPAA